VVAYGQSDTPVNLFVIADLSTMWVVADVYEPDVPKLRRDEPMVATLRCCPGERYEGQVSYISDAVDKETRTVKVRSIVANRAARSRPRCSSTSPSRPDNPGADHPQSAVHREGSETYVLLAKAKIS
jgi:hypothetical protein